MQITKWEYWVLLATLPSTKIKSIFQQCCTKFQSKPQGTKLSISNSAGNMFPSVTFCPYPVPVENGQYIWVYNSTILLNCGINWKQYKRESKWSNQAIENCEHPKSLYYNIIWKLEDLISKRGHSSITSSRRWVGGLDKL